MPLVTAQIRCGNPLGRCPEGLSSSQSPCHLLQPRFVSAHHRADALFAFRPHTWPVPAHPLGPPSSIHEFCLDGRIISYKKIPLMITLDSGARNLENLKKDEKRSLEQRCWKRAWEEKIKFVQRCCVACSEMGCKYRRRGSVMTHEEVNLVCVRATSCLLGFWLRHVAGRDSEAAACE